MKNASDMTIEEFALHLQQMKDRVFNFHLYGGSNVGKRTDRSYANQQRGNFFGKVSLSSKGKYDG